MVLSSGQLEAFSEVAKTRSFSAAAKNLHITQSALSQRVANLESELSTALIVRDPAGLRLTSAGEELLRYCRVKEGLEAEVLSNISSSQSGIRGVIRIGAFSSVMRSVLMPSLDKLISQNPDLNVELFTREVRELPKMLSNNEVDLIVTIDEPFRQDLESVALGHENNVLVESTTLRKERAEIYLDHDPDDETSAQFLKLNGHSAKLHRNYLDDVYGIIEGVKRGWGRGVLPKHLVQHEKSLRQVKGYKALKVPVMLQYLKLPYYPKLFSTVVEEVLEKAPHYLSK